MPASLVRGPLELLGHAWGLLAAAGPAMDQHHHDQNGQQDRRRAGRAKAHAAVVGTFGQKIAHSGAEGTRQNESTPEETGPGKWRDEVSKQDQQHGTGEDRKSDG